MTNKPQQKILIIKHGALGDWILASGLFAKIRCHYPSATLYLLTSPAYKKLATQCAFFDEIICDKRVSIVNHEYWKLIISLRKYHFDIVFDFQNSSRTKNYFRFLNLSKDNWFNAHHHLDSHNISNNDHVLVKNAQIMKKAGVNDFPSPDLSWLIAHKCIAPISQPYALLIPGCSAKHLKTKAWSVHGYRDVINHLNKHQILPVILGRSEDAIIINQIINLIDSDKVLNLYEKTSLADIAYLANNAAMSIGSDTGIMHIAGVLSPAVVFYAKGHNPELNRPWGSAIYPIANDDLKTLSSQRVIITINQIMKSVDYKSRKTNQLSLV